MMASAEDRPIQFDPAVRERRVHDRRHRPFGAVTRVELAPAAARIAWSGVWGGFFIALGIWLTLTTLGTAVGLSTMNPGADLSADTASRASAAWLYISGLIALFFGGVFGTRLALVVDQAVAWMEATLIWSFALVLTMILGTTLLSIAAAHPVAASEIAQATPTVTTHGSMVASAWLGFIGIVIAWVVTVLGSFWGRSQARVRARTLGLAA
jgi:hypothetical protein